MKREMKKCDQNTSQDIFIAKKNPREALKTLYAYSLDKIEFYLSKLDGDECERKRERERHLMSLKKAHRLFFQEVIFNISRFIFVVLWQREQKTAERNETGIRSQIFIESGIFHGR